MKVFCWCSLSLRTLVAEVFRDSHATKKEFACARQVNIVEDIALQNRQKGSRIVIILSMDLFSGMAVYFILLNLCCIFSLIKHERVRTYDLISQFSTKNSEVDCSLFLTLFTLQCCKMVRCTARFLKCQKTNLWQCKVKI